MDCQRCHGFLVMEHFEDAFAGAIPTRTVGWRCVNCGELYDALVLFHQMRMHQRNQPSVQNRID